jgi:hypothetical protein
MTIADLLKAIHTYGEEMLTPNYEGKELYLDDVSEICEDITQHLEDMSTDEESE